MLMETSFISLPDLPALAFLANADGHKEVDTTPIAMTR
jgi:hypothetical protein